MNAFARHFALQFLARAVDEDMPMHSCIKSGFEVRRRGMAHTPGARRFSVVAPSSDFVAAMDDPNYWETAGLQSAFTRVR